MEKVYLSLGSNLGDREENLRRALERINPAKQSSIYETEPQDLPGQPWFLNMVVECETDLSATEFFLRICAIERELGRIRTVPKGSRTIDIDVLLFGEETIATPELTVPHPRMTQRRFVLEPLLEIAPHLTPRYGPILATLKNQGARLIP